jgi:hypothetical protein
MLIRRMTLPLKVWWRPLSCLVGGLLLAGCGGGSEDLGSPAPPIGQPPTAPVVGSATLSWVAPTVNEDGSALTNLAGYRIFYGQSASNLDRQLNLASASANQQVIGDLSRGTWFFSIRAYTNSGLESADSVIVSKTIN